MFRCSPDQASERCTTSQGRRRLELFGEDHNIRPGWVTIGRDLSGSNFSPQARALDPPKTPIALKPCINTLKPNTP